MLAGLLSRAPAALRLPCVSSLLAAVPRRLQLSTALRAASSAAAAPAKEATETQSILPPRPSSLRNKRQPPKATGPKAPLVATHKVIRNDGVPSYMRPPRTAAAAPAASGSFGSASMGTSTSASDSDATRSSTSGSEGEGAVAEAVTRTAPAAAAAGGAAGPAPVFAVIALCGTQYKVTPGDVLYVEHIPGAEVGGEITVGPESVLMLGSSEVTVLGRPSVPGASVVLGVREQAQAAKLTVYKKRRRKRYQRTKGHRRLVTVLEVKEVKADLKAY